MSDKIISGHHRGGKYWIVAQKEDGAKYSKMVKLDEIYDISIFNGPEATGWFSDMVASTPELPAELRERYQKEYGLNEYESNVIIEYVYKGNGLTAGVLVRYFEDAVEYCGEGKACFNWISGQLLGFLNDKDISPEESYITPQMIGELVNCIKFDIITNNTAKKVFEKMISDKLPPHKIIDKYNMIQKADAGELEGWVDAVIKDNPKVVEQYREGKQSVMGFFVGQIMKLSKGTANPKTLTPLLKEKLK